MSILLLLCFFVCAGGPAVFVKKVLTPFWFVAIIIYIKMNVKRKNKKIIKKFLGRETAEKSPARKKFPRFALKIGGNYIFI
jgi:hypothetical protein